MMAGKFQTDRRFQSEDSRGTSPDAAASGDVDSLVSNFLQELTGISTSIKQAPLPEAVEAAAEASAPIEAEPQQELPPFEALEPQPGPLESREEISLEPEPDLAAINNEIEATLAELERQKPVVIPITFPKEAVKAPPSPPARSPERSPAAPSPRPTSRRPEARTAPKSEEQDWTRLDIFRAEVANARSARRRKICIIAIAGVVLSGIILYFLFSQSDSVLGVIGQCPCLKTNPLTCASNGNSGLA
jgi:hypothetical protein